MDALQTLQTLFADVYDLHIEHDVRDFLCAEHVAQALKADSSHRGESLLLVEKGDDIELGLYLAPEVLAHLAALTRKPPRQLSLKDLQCWWLAIEGLSHFNYLMHRHRYALGISQLELELQGEVDKYALSLCAWQRMGNTATWRAFSMDLREWLYERVRFIDASSSIRGQRYRFANQLALHYSAWLEKQQQRAMGWAELQRELRRFYRMNLQAKAHRIRMQVGRPLYAT